MQSLSRSLQRKSSRPPTAESSSLSAPASTSDSHATQISIYYQNSRGLGSKHKRFFCTSSSYEYDIIILTETWLKKDILSAEFFDNSYAVYRKDRNIKRGGGVLIALNNETFASEQIDIPNTDNLEYVCIKAITGSHRMFIYNAYIPPNSSSEVYLVGCMRYR